MNENGQKALKSKGKQWKQVERNGIRKKATERNGKQWKQTENVENHREASGRI